MESYKNLIVWQDSRRLNREIYNLAFKFPRFELYALSDQLRRACVSVTSNIAEGYYSRRLWAGELKKSTPLSLYGAWLSL